MTIQPDGKLYVQSGVGNLGTHSCIDLARVAAEVLAMPWDKVVVNWGSTAKNVPWSAMSVGSQTTHAMTRANLAGAVDARLKLQEIAAKDLGGAPADYVLGNERVLPARQPVARPDATRRRRRARSSWAASTTATSCPPTSTRSRRNRRRRSPASA